MHLFVPRVYKTKTRLKNTKYSFLCCLWTFYWIFIWALFESNSKFYSSLTHPPPSILFVSEYRKIFSKPKYWVCIFLGYFATFLWMRLSGFHGSTWSFKGFIVYTSLAFCWKECSIFILFAWCSLRVYYTHAFLRDAHISQVVN